MGRIPKRKRNTYQTIKILAKIIMKNGSRERPRLIRIVNNWNLAEKDWAVVGVAGDCRQWERRVGIILRFLVFEK